MNQQNQPESPSASWVCWCLLQGSTFNNHPAPRIHPHPRTHTELFCETEATLSVAAKAELGGSHKPHPLLEVHSHPKVSLAARFLEASEGSPSTETPNQSSEL